ncbi:hypothetical protein JAAARDRAFT_405696 [Jaapia argillacea MUCL 33604]|uniref:Uncharacterized protein n=1 Tax=Jaapia argillacea MUCL 33604 TaxID=933084 RepID=A0A067PHR0_9AGAM|nr:hypothetical protein JAAARDRAFT_405696 [Jaapia argillacea MUCL 33604]
MASPTSPTNLFSFFSPSPRSFPSPGSTRSISIFRRGIPSTPFPVSTSKLPSRSFIVRVSGIWSRERGGGSRRTTYARPGLESIVPAKPNRGSANCRAVELSLLTSPDLTASITTSLLALTAAFETRYKYSPLHIKRPPSLRCVQERCSEDFPTRVRLGGPSRTCLIGN